MSACFREQKYVCSARTNILKIIVWNNIVLKDDRKVASFVPTLDSFDRILSVVLQAVNSSTEIIHTQFKVGRHGDLVVFTCI